MNDIIIVAGSNNKNLELAKEFSNELESNKVNHEVLDLTSLDLPLYSPKAEKDGAPKVIPLLCKQFCKAKGFIFLAPEYNGGIPPAVTNLIAWISRGGGADWRMAFNAKPVGIGSFSGGGGAHVLMALRAQLSYIGMNVLGRQALVNGNRPINHDTVKDMVRQLLQLTRIM